MKEVKWGVIGLGEQAVKRMIPAISRSEGALLCGVCSGSEEKAEEVAREHKDVKCFKSFDEFLANEDMEAVYISTPHHLHVPHAFQSIGAGKHVLVEKPMSMSVDGATKLVEAAKKNEVILGVGYQLRQHPGLLYLKEMMEKEEIGKLELIIVNLHEAAQLEKGWKTDTIHSGPAGLMHLGVHALDMIQWLKAGRAVEVISAARTDDTGDGHVNSVSIIVSFSDGSQGIVSVSSRLPGAMNQLMIIGTDAQVCADLEWPQSNRKQKILIKKPEGEEIKEFQVEDLFAREIESFTRAVNEGSQFSPSGSENIPVVELTCAVIESMNSRRSVRVGEVLRTSG